MRFIFKKLFYFSINMPVKFNEIKSKVDKAKAEDLQSRMQALQEYSEENEKFISPRKTVKLVNSNMIKLEDVKQMMKR